MPEAPGRLAGYEQPDADRLRSLAHERAEQAWGKSSEAVTLAKRHQTWEYGVGVPGVIATAAGSASLLVDVPVGASILALLGGIATGLSGFLGSRALAQHHWNRHAGFEKIAQRYENLEMARENPTRVDLDALADEWEKYDKGMRPDGAK